MRYWRRHAARRRTRGPRASGQTDVGTSAGLAVLGEHVYGALDGGSRPPPDAARRSDGTSIDARRRFPAFCRSSPTSSPTAISTSARVEGRLHQLDRQAGAPRRAKGHHRYRHRRIHRARDRRRRPQARVFSGNAAVLVLAVPSVTCGRCLRTRQAAKLPRRARDRPRHGQRAAPAAVSRVERPAFEVVYDVEAGKITKRPKPLTPKSAFFRMGHT